MKRKILRGVLIAACQFFLLTGIVSASEVHQEYFNLKSFQEIGSWVEGKVEKEYLDKVENAYNKVYKLEKEMKYFSADKKWNDIFDLIRHIDKRLLEEYEGDEDIEDAIEELQEYIDDYSSERDYRYGLPSFDEAYDMEIKDYVYLLPYNHREIFKKRVEKKYIEMESACQELINVTQYKDSKNRKDRIKYLEKLQQFNTKRGAVKSLMNAINTSLVITKNDIYMIGEVCYQPERFDQFLKEPEVVNVIGEKNIGKLRNLMKEACEADSDIETDDLLDEIEEMIYDYYNDRDENKTIIDDLYDEIN